MKSRVLPTRALTLAGFFLYMIILSQVSYSQWFQQGPKLVGTGAVGNPSQGHSVSISSDGNTAIVGGLTDNSYVGASWAFTRSGGVWTQQGPKLVGAGAVGGNSQQGISVSISSDGNTAIVGGWGDNGVVGAAWVFTRSGGIWTQQGPKLVGTGAVGVAAQGFSVAISSDGNTAIVGGFRDNSFVGAAWVFTRSGGVWTQQGPKLVGTGAVGNAYQGQSVSVSSDGNTAIVGGHRDNNLVGAAWVFTRSGGVWTQQGPKLVGTGAAGVANQGHSVSISSDGNTAIIGGLYDNSGTGAAWAFTRSGGVWTQQGPKLVGTGAVGVANQGHSVSVSSDGNTAIVGGYRDNNLVGAIWAFTRNGGVWTQQGPKLVGTGAVGVAHQGHSVSISSDGNTAIVGGYLDNNGVGAAWVLSKSLFITRPQAGERWIAGGQDTIRWEGRALGTFVAVDYSTDSGQTYTNIVPAALLDSLIWSIPTNILTTRAKVRVRTVATPLHTAISDTFKIKGDVLTRIDPKGHYEAFSPRKHGWSYLNGTLWPATWWSQFQYATGLDPNTGAPYPVSFQAVAPSIFVDWPLWVDVFSTNACYWSTAFPGSYNATAQTKWATSRGVHNGSCEGFAISSFLAFSYPNQFFTRHNIPNVDSLFKLALNDTIRKTINRYYTYQYGKPSLDNDVPGQAKDPRTTLREIRNMFRGDSVDIRPVYVYNLGPSGGAHTMAPISVTVDGTGPSRYRVNLYDSNNPGVATPYILVDSLNNRWVDSTGLRWGPSPTHFYLGIPVSNHLATPAMGRPPSGYSPRGLNNWEFYNNSDAEVVYTSSTGNRIGFADSGLIDEMQDGVAIFNRNGRPSKPIGYYIPNDTYSVTLARVRDSSGGAHVTVFKDDVVYAYERANDDSMLTDRLQFGSGFSVASPDTAQKQISLNVIARLDSSERIFFVRNTQLRQNDSLFTREISQSNLVLKNYGTAKTYHLEINERSAQEQEIFVHPLIALPANSTHTIVPNWIDLDGSPIEILVDLGNNGTIDDTLIVNNTVDVDDRGDLGVPREYHLAQNYPNPFNPNTRIEYTLPQAGHVNLSVYNVLGQHVATLVDEERSAGRYSVEWNGTSANGGILGSGVYFYTMIARPSAGGETFRRTGKMLLLK